MNAARSHRRRRAAAFAGVTSWRRVVTSGKYGWRTPGNFGIDGGGRNRRAGRSTAARCRPNQREFTSSSAKSRRQSSSKAVADRAAFIIERGSLCWSLCLAAWCSLVHDRVTPKTRQSTSFKGQVQSEITHSQFRRRTWGRIRGTSPSLHEIRLNDFKATKEVSNLNRRILVRSNLRRVLAADPPIFTDGRLHRLWPDRVRTSNRARLHR